MREAVSKLFKRSTLTFMSAVLALSSVTPLASALTAYAAPAPLSADVTCVNEKAVLTVTARQAYLPGLPANAENWKPSITGLFPNVHYTTNFGSASQTLTAGDEDYKVYNTNSTEIAGGTAKARVTGWYTTKEIRYIFGFPFGTYNQDHYYENNSLTATYAAKNCDATAPTATVSYSPNTLTNGNVVATIETNEPIQAVAGWTTVNNKKLQKTYAANTNETVVVYDLAGNPKSVNVVITWIDTTAPDVVQNLGWTTTNNKSITNNGATNELAGTAKWNASPSADTNHYIYKYWNDIAGNQYKVGSEYTTTTSSTSLPGVFNQGEGTHHFCIVAVDNLGNKSVCSDTFTITYDKTRPVVTTSNENFYNPASLTISATDSGSGVQKVTGNVYKFDTASDSYKLFKGNSSTSQNPFTVDLSTLADGKYNVRYNAADNATNVSLTDQFNFVVDHTAPAVPTHVSPFNNAVQNVSDFWFEWEDVEGAVSYEAQFSQSDSVDGDGSLNVGVWSGDSNHNQPTVSKAWSTGANGTWFWQVRAIDAAGNKSAWSAPWKLTIDKVAPATPTHVSPEDGAVSTSANQTLIDWSDVTDQNGVKYVYQSSTSSDKNSDGSFTNPAYTSGALSTSEIPTPNTPEGVYYWHIKAVDGAGNESAWSDAWMITIDNTAPTLSLNSVATGTATSRTITGTSEPDAEVTVTVHSTPQTKTVFADQDGKWSVTFDNLEVGPHTVVATSKDKAGNVTSELTQEFAVTTVPVNNQNENNDGDNTGSNTNQGSPLVAFNNNGGNAGNADEDVLGTETDNSNGAANNNSSDSSDDSEVKGATDKVASTAGNVFGLAWYWWLLILAALAAAWWLIAAWRRRQNEA